MNLVARLALAILLGVFSVLGAFTVWRVRGEIETFDREIRRDHRIIGLTASAALSKTRTRQEAMRLAERIDASRERIGVRYVSLGPAPDSGMKPSYAISQQEAPLPGGWTQLEQPGDGTNGRPEFLVTYVRAPLIDEPDGAIELTESLTPRAAYISRGVAGAVGSSVAMLFVCGLLVTSLSARLVGKPVTELITAVRRIGGGDFDALANIQRSDEFGELALALRSMSVELQAAREKMLADAAAKIRALEQLRHAERLATLGQLASVLAHEIGTPLNVIGGHAKMIATGKLDGDETRESGRAIGSQCERMTQIVRRILDYARRRPPRRSRISATDVLRQAQDLLKGLAEQREVYITIDASDGRDELFADPGQLQQAVINLVMNAIQASKAGGSVNLGVAIAAESASRCEEFVVLSVRDSGAGMAPGAQDRIFEPFFTTKPPGEGTGLGLSVARDIVVEHGGFIQVSSEVDAGSTFRVFLPRGVADAGSDIGR